MKKGYIAETLIGEVKKSSGETLKAFDVTLQDRRYIEIRVYRGGMITKRGFMLAMEDVSALKDILNAVNRGI